METLKLSKETAKEIYNDKDSPSWIKKILESTFKPEAFKKPHFTDLKTFDGCCMACGTSEKKFDEAFKKLNLQSDTIAYEKLKIINKAINQGWTPDWNNASQYKYWPWFVLSSGFGFSASNYNYDNGDTQNMEVNHIV